MRKYYKNLINRERINVLNFPLPFVGKMASDVTNMRKFNFKRISQNGLSNSYQILIVSLYPRPSWLSSYRARQQCQPLALRVVSLSFGEDKTDLWLGDRMRPHLGKPNIATHQIRVQ